MKPFKHYHRWYYYTRTQRLGFVFLVLLVVAIQGIFYFYNRNTNIKHHFTSENYLRIKQQVDSLSKLKNNKRDTIYPFNPNFISDFKGLQLEMTVDQLDRLFEYRKKNLYINSEKEFQALTQVSDEWMAKYQRYFKFPDWVIAKNDKNSGRFRGANSFGSSEVQKPRLIKDINQATAEDLIEVRGIGPAYSKRIIEARTKYGGFVSIEQVRFLNLPNEAVEEVLKYFVVNTAPSIKLVKVNTASIDDLKVLPYLNYYIAREIVKYRSMEGDIVNKNDLSKIEKIPLDKIDIISLYLDFKN